jgi:hypothetical protein
MTRTAVTPGPAVGRITITGLVGTRTVGEDADRCNDLLASTPDTPASAEMTAVTISTWLTIVVGKRSNFWAAPLGADIKPAPRFGSPNHHQHQKSFRRGSVILFVDGLRADKKKKICDQREKDSEVKTSD